MSKIEKGQEINLETEKIVVEIPVQAIEVKITAKIYFDGEIHEVENKMSLKEIREAFDDAEENYIPPDASFVITEKGKQYLKELEEGLA